MQKDKLIELVRLRLSGGAISTDTMHKYDPRIIEQRINVLYSDLINTISAKKGVSMDTYVRLYKDVPIALDTDTDTYYSAFPATPVRMPVVGDCVRSIKSMEGVGIEFAPTYNTSFLYYTEGYSLDDVIKYSVKERIEYSHPDGVTLTEVAIEMIPQFTEYDDEEEVPIPVGFEKTIVDDCVMFFQNQPPLDPINNNSDKV